MTADGCGGSEDAGRRQMTRRAARVGCCDIVDLVHLGADGRRWECPTCGQRFGETACGALTRAGR